MREGITSPQFLVVQFAYINSSAGHRHAIIEDVRGLSCRLRVRWQVTSLNMLLLDKALDERRTKSQRIGYVLDGTRWEEARPDVQRCRHHGGPRCRGSEERKGLAVGAE